MSGCLLSIFLLLLLFTSISTQSVDNTNGNTTLKTPFCSVCNCTIQTDQSVDVDCSGFAVKNYIYETSYWFSDKNNSIPYPIRSINLQNQGISELKNQFLSSGLTKLDLSHNNIAEIADSVFANLQAMESLNLGFNDLSVLEAEAFRGIREDLRDYPLKALKELRLNNNKFHSLQHDVFDHVDAVEVLDISYNPFGVIDDSTHIAIASLTFLKELDLSFTEIKDIPEHLLHTPKYLTVLNLSGNKIENVPQAFSESQNLETLYLDNNPIYNISVPNVFPKIMTLKTLHMCNMPKLYYIGKGALSALQNLEELYVMNNVNLSEIHPGALTRREEGAENEVWPPIRKLDLNNNKLTSLDFHFILKWDKLVHLDLRYNPWTCECENQWMIEELMEAYIKVNETLARQITCAAPIEMKGQTFYELYSKKSIMRCLDLYGNRPENDATILVGILAGLLIGIPIVLAIMYAYQRNCFGICDKSPASYSRQFYSRTSSDDVNF